ncbi:hypothetical protein RAD16_07165 [Bradyrhizobium sp. 18BD]
MKDIGHSCAAGAAPVNAVEKLKRNEIGMNRHRALGCYLSMIFPENRFALCRIML